MINVKTAGLKITLLTFSMVSVMACKKIFLKPQPVVQGNAVNYNGINCQRKDDASVNIFRSEKESFVENFSPFSLSFRFFQSK